MESYGTREESTLKIIGTTLAGSLYFWISLVGFVFTNWGFRITHDSFFGLGYGFFGIILAFCIFAACVQAHRRRSVNRRRDPSDDDILD